MLALMGFLSTGKVEEERYLGMKLPPPNLQPSYSGEATAFAGELADGLGCEDRA